FKNPKCSSHIPSNKMNKEICTTLQSGGRMMILTWIALLPSTIQQRLIQPVRYLGKEIRGKKPRQ
ncbi:MAG: hypothetical protein AB2693_11545, partial [Candidatus Thiodiazotropha sp.]